MRRLVMALAAVSLLGCGGGDSTGPGGTNVVGTWNLTTVNSSGLPFTLAEVAGSYKLEVLADQFTFNANGTWSGTATFRETDNGTVTTTTEPDNGTWSQAGSNVTKTYSDGSTATATISGNRITFVEIGITAIYQRQ